MFRSALLIGLICLSASKAAEPINCETVEKDLDACADRVLRVDRGGERVFIEECLKLAEAERFHGTWATDFEFNEFYNGEMLAPNQVWQFPEPSTVLVTEGSDLGGYDIGASAKVFEVDFIGRRNACNLTEPIRAIVVDEVMDVRLIDDRPSDWYSRKGALEL